ncbi:MAG: hypothetical protein OXI87_24920 [Albidovulum sp.]|nr:hypothetical protein [Albidovulum sp.]
MPSDSLRTAQTRKSRTTDYCIAPTPPAGSLSEARHALRVVRAKGPAPPGGYSPVFEYWFEPVPGCSDGRPRPWIDQAEFLKHKSSFPVIAGRARNYDILDVGLPGPAVLNRVFEKNPGASADARAASARPRREGRISIGGG